MKYLFIAPFPPPVTGNSLAVEVLYNNLSQSNDVKRLNLSKSSMQNGFTSLKRVFEIFTIYYKLIFEVRKSDIIYFTISESIAGNLKDLIIFLLSYSKLDNMYIHLHGGAGYKVILSSKHPFLKKLNSYFLKKLKGIIVLGETHKHIFEHIIDNDKLHIVPNFSENKFFINTNELEIKYSKRNKLKVLFLSNLIEGKGYKELVAAYKMLGPKYIDRIEINFAGAFESDASQKEFLLSISGYTNMNYHGIVYGEKKKEMLFESHVFCLPTYYPYEGQPISILEAYSSGCIVLTTNHSGIFDIFKNNINGYEVIKKSSDSIKDILEQLVDNLEGSKRIAKFNISEAWNKYTVEKHLNNIKFILK